MSGPTGPTIYVYGEVSERSKEHAWKACIRLTPYRGFESRSLRQLPKREGAQEGPFSFRQLEEKQRSLNPRLKGGFEKIAGARPAKPVERPDRMSGLGSAPGMVVIRSVEACFCLNSESPTPIITSSSSMAACAGSPAVARCKPRQARKGATVAEASRAGSGWRGRPPSSVFNLRTTLGRNPSWIPPKPGAHLLVRPFAAMRLTPVP